MLVMESRFAGGGKISCSKKLGEDQAVSYGRVSLWEGMLAVVRGAEISKRCVMESWFLNGQVGSSQQRVHRCKEWTESLKLERVHQQIVNLGAYHHYYQGFKFYFKINNTFVQNNFTLIINIKDQFVDSVLKIILSALQLLWAYFRLVQYHFQTVFQVLGHILLIAK